MTAEVVRIKVPPVKVLTTERLSIKEVAVPRSLARNTVCSTARNGKLPASKIRGQCRIRHTETFFTMDWEVA